MQMVPLPNVCQLTIRHMQDLNVALILMIWVAAQLPGKHIVHSNCHPQSTQ